MVLADAVHRPRSSDRDSARETHETVVKSRHVETQGEAQPCTAPQEFRCDSVSCQCELCIVMYSYDELCNLRQQSGTSVFLAVFCSAMKASKLTAENLSLQLHCHRHRTATSGAWEPWHFRLVLGIRHRSPRLPETPNIPQLGSRITGRPQK